jgi:hypothetical protein
MNPPRFGTHGVTIQDVAERAGVSKKTVSRVINGEEYVSEPTAVKVRETIAEMGYVPNVSARRLASKRSNVLTLVYQAEEPPGWLTHVIQGIVQAASARGFEVVIHPCDAGEEASQRSLQALVLRGGTDGLILLPPFGSLSDFNRALRPESALARRHDHESRRRAGDDGLSHRPWAHAHRVYSRCGGLQWQLGAAGGVQGRAGLGGRGGGDRVDRAGQLHL